MRTKFALLVAIVLGLIAVIGVKHLIEREQVEIRKGFKFVPVVAASKRIEAGTLIRESHLEKKEIVESALHDKSILWSERTGLIGTKIQTTVNRGDQLLWTYFETGRQEEEPSRVLLPGERALTLSVNTTSGVAGLIRPNSHVDILGTFVVQGVPGQPGGGTVQTVTLLSDVTVLAIDNVTAATLARQGGMIKRSYTSVTVAVTPIEAQVLTYAQRQGNLTLALRSPTEVGSAQQLPKVDLSNFLELSKQANMERQKKQENEAALREAHVGVP